MPDEEKDEKKEGLLTRAPCSEKITRQAYTKHNSNPSLDVEEGKAFVAEEKKEDDEVMGTIFP